MLTQKEKIKKAQIVFDKIPAEDNDWEIQEAQ